MNAPLRKTDPDYDAIRSRAFGHAIATGRLTRRQIDELLEAGTAELRRDLTKLERCPGCNSPNRETCWRVNHPRGWEPHPHGGEPTPCCPHSWHQSEPAGVPV